MRIQNKIYSTSTIFILTSLVLIVFLIYPIFKDIQKGFAKIPVNKQKMAYIYTESKELENFKKNLADYETNLKKADQSLLDAKNPIDFIKFLEKISSELNLDININLVSSKKEEKSLNSNFQIHVEGAFQDIIKFSQRLEAGPYLLKINSLLINKDKQDEKEKRFSGTVSAIFLVEVVNK